MDKNSINQNIQTEEKMDLEFVLLWSGEKVEIKSQFFVLIDVFTKKNNLFSSIEKLILTYLTLERGGILPVTRGKKL